MLATQAEVIELTHDRVELRLSVRAFATEANRKRLAEDLSRYLGHPFHVAFEVGNVSEGATVAAEQRRERAAEHLALVDAFSKDPFVKSIVEIFHGTVDEGSVRAAEEAELPAGSKRRTRRGCGKLSAIPGTPTNRSGVPNRTNLTEDTTTCAEWVAWAVWAD